MILQDFYKKLQKCSICPRKCGVDRTKQAGYCGATAEIQAARAMLHTGEEPCLIGKKGAGAIFFSGCNLRCVYCQNYEISWENQGWAVSPEKLERIMLELQDQGAACLDLVTPTPYLPQLLPVLQHVRPKLHIPVVYNCGGYEEPETLAWLQGLVDIFLPDLKYRDSALAKAYSGCAGYFEKADAALRQMFKMVGAAQFDAAGQMKRGLLVRHLVLPGAYRDSMALMRYLGEAFPAGSIRVSLMSQYTPYGRAAEFPALNRRVTTYEYRKVVEEALACGLEGYSQERSSSTMALRPAFDGTGVI